MKNQPSFLLKLLQTILLLCSILQVLAQDSNKQFPTDIELMNLVNKHISSPITNIKKANGETYLQRNFSDYLHASPAFSGPEPQGNQADYGHDHNIEELETFLNRPHPSVATLEKYFATAAAEFEVPVEILRAYAQIQSNWAQVSESMYGSWGVMGLIENPFVGQISKAATLIKCTPEAIKTDAKSNIRAAAALLAFYQKKQGFSPDAGAWFESVCELTGLKEKNLQQSLAQRVYRVISEGSKTVSIWGEIISIQPDDKISVPETIAKNSGETEVELLGNGTPDYPNAVYSLTTCNFGSRPAGAGINFYFVHYIATGTYEGAISWFKNCTSQVSAHYVVRNSDGQITQVVDEEDRAWSQGVTEYNDQGIGVEHEVIVTNLSMWDSEPMLREAGKLAADVCNRNLIPKQRRTNNGEKGIYGHSDVRATDCPNMTQERWNNFLTKVTGALPAVGTPTLFSIQSTEGSSAVTATWKANTEPSRLGYRLYYATNDALTDWALAANENTLTPGVTSVTLQSAQFMVPPKDPVYHFRLTAVVPNGTDPVVESGASDVYSRSWMTTGPKVLIVDGFDRTSGSYKNSTHSFTTSYFKALRERGVVQVSSAANEKIEDGSINLINYNIVIWYVGDESSANVVFSAAEKTAITNFLNSGGQLLVSGSEIAYNVGRAAAAGYDLNFMNNYLKSSYVNDGTASYTPATGSAGTGFEGLNIPFGIVYPEDFPDAITPLGGAISILNYSVAPNIGGIAYKGTFGGNSGIGSIIYVSFPLETASDINLSTFMQKALVLFGIDPLPAPPVTLNDAVEARKGQAKRINVLANDNGNGSPFNPGSILLTTAPANGKATPKNDGTVVYVPNKDYTGTDAFSYKAANSSGLYSNPSTVQVNVLEAESCAATPPEVDDNFPLRELRGAWVTSVFNLDWPTSRTASPATQQAELLRIMDTLRNTGFNTIFLQVRTGSDALYQSPYEPWSYYLTGTEGVAPSPFWDPLQFAVDAAHERGLELHAWVNPYRARTGSFALAANHVMNQQPGWVLNVGAAPILNPGLPEVRTYLANIMADIATRYDVDGVHFDDYFYPSGITAGMQDAATYASNNPKGIATIEDWRRDNVNQMIARVYDTIQQINTSGNRNIIFGVSPFGIWKSGTPAGIVGQSSFSALYCDPIAWLQAGKVDYLAPQLYWKITGAQDYNILSQWWNEQGKLYNRPIYTGHAWYKMVDANNWAAAEIEEQIKLNRLPVRNEILGEIGYRTGQIMANSKNLKNALQQGLYRYKSYVPAYSWKDAVCPNAPTNVRLEGDTLRWDAPLPAADGDIARNYVVYRFENETDAATLANDGTKVVDIVAKNKVKITNAGSARFAVSALDKNNNESSAALGAMPDVVLCPGGSTALPAMENGNQFTWQVLNGEIWEPLSDPAYFSGTNSATLVISNLPVSYYGTKLRCLVNGNIPGPVYTLKFGTAWTATQSANWSNPANWNCGIIPTIETDAIIYGNVTPFPVVDIMDAAARTVKLLTGAQVNVLPGMKITIGQ
jgi:uncharacterized lipoprotein YddW (UPF0748 family)